MIYIWKIGIAVGLPLLFLGPLAVRHAWRLTRDRAAVARWGIRTILFATAAVLFVIVPRLSYMADANTRVFGIPFFSMIWAREGDHWTDFIGPFTALAHLGNALVGAFLPFIAGAGVLRAWPPHNSRMQRTSARGDV